MHRTHGNGREIDERVDSFSRVCAGAAAERREPRRAPSCAGARSTRSRTPVVPHERHVLDGVRSGTLAGIVSFGF